MSSVTYFPEDKSLFAGHHEDIETARPHEYLASLNETITDGIVPGTGIAGKVHDYKFADISPQFASMKRGVLKKRALEKMIKRTGYTPEIARIAQNLERTAAVNDSAIEQLTIVQFVQQIIGRLKNVNTISQAFTKITTNNLRGKIPEGAWPNVSLQVSRLSEPEITHTDFGQTDYRIKRNDIHLYISREDRMEASIDPFSFSTAQGQMQMMQARDLLALKALSGANEPTTHDIADPTAASSTVGTNTVYNAVPRAKNDTVGSLLEMLTNHYTTNRTYLNKIIINNLDYRAIETNYFSRNNIKQEPVQGFGVTPFVGLQAHGITAYISPWVPRTMVYALADEGAYEIDGPKVVDSEYDARKFADYMPIRDFIGYKLVNPARFTAKLTLTLAGVSAGTEITTDKQIETLLKPVKPAKGTGA